MTKPLRSIQMLFCRIDIGSDWIATHFPDGTSYGAEPQMTAEYVALAQRCGYGGDVLRYAHEHEIAHALIGEVVYRGPSRVVWGCAHGKYAPSVEILAEEELCISLQAFARAGTLPGSSAPGFDWFALRYRFLQLCDEVSP
ncbi:protein of unknown function [Pseudorhizobium banfieldiae]|uniref:Uncharacterized protein n=1 Tax=Pseudorhizobium banfieldiae TaxID=1125847 RepID=L0NE55_9HYPH|nr:hypothetical protein [Pseudorhizobium banfieldiae]CAD6605872.1 hypothetical protein RNT25_01740 [arsenite-oxidising bacterium NT-25]CCF19086.1 protein of unknown function [Pseudorhizobium banfieldiae]